jgi:hypothetical protein
MTINICLAVIIAGLTVLMAVIVIERHAYYDKPRHGIVLVPHK